MKKFSKYLMSAATVTALALSTGAFLKVYAAEAPASVVAGQPVDLTYAAEKALPSVVHIKYVQNSKTKTVEVQDDPWGSRLDRVARSERTRSGNDHQTDACALDRGPGPGHPVFLPSNPRPG